jgi:ketosteroid isomerase-like protein
VDAVSELDELQAAVAGLRDRVRLLEDHLQITQLVAQYGPAVDSGSADATAALWTDDGVFDAAGALEMHGHDEIAGMVHSDGHQDLIRHGCGHVLTVPHVVVHGDQAEGRSYALNIRWDPDTQRFWVARLSANTWRWVRTSDGWRIAHRVNANLDGTPEHRQLLAPGAPEVGRT